MKINDKDAFPNPFDFSEGAIPYRGGGTVRAYHGTASKPYVPTKSGGYTETPPPSGEIEKFGRPGDYSNEPAVFFTPRPDVASAYAGDMRYSPGSRVFPVDISLKNAAQVDASKLPGRGDYFALSEGNYLKRAIDLAKERGKDVLIVRNMRDVGTNEPQDQILALHPAGHVKSAITKEVLFGLGGGLAASPLLSDEELKKMIGEKKDGNS